MKKAKLMLAAIAVFAIVGGTLAAKAKRNSSLYCSTATTTTGTLTAGITTTIPSANGVTSFCTLAPNVLVKRTYITTDL